MGDDVAILAIRPVTNQAMRFDYKLGDEAILGEFIDRHQNVSNIYYVFNVCKSGGT